jgi:hypothetical protein
MTSEDCTLIIDEPVGDIVEAGGAVLRRNRRPEKTDGAHLAKDARIGFFVAERLEHARGELLLAVGVRCIAQHAFFLRQLLLEQQRIVPHELGFHLFDGRIHQCILSRITASPWPTPMQSDTAA